LRSDEKVEELDAILIQIVVKQFVQILNARDTDVSNLILSQKLLTNKSRCGER
jgi:hypothetical protein